MEQSLVNLNLKKSSHVKSAMYDKLTHNLIVVFTNNSVYQYFGVTDEEVSGWQRATSVGEYFHQKIKSNSYTRIG